MAIKRNHLITIISIWAIFSLLVILISAGLNVNPYIILIFQLVNVIGILLFSIKNNKFLMAIGIILILLQLLIFIFI